MDKLELNFKPYYEDKYVTIVHGDCEQMLKWFSNNSASLVLTDPPYGCGFDTWDTLHSFDWLTECRRISPLTFVISGTTHLQDYPKANWVACWARPGSVQRAGGGGFSHWEPILIYGKNPLDVDCKVFSANTEDSGFNHPCPKPLKVLKWLISGSKTDGVILDPFMGSGTTLRAAKDLNRKSIGIEINEAYCEVAAKRCQQEVMELGI